MGTLGLIPKTQNTPDVSTIHDALSIAQPETKAHADGTKATLEGMKTELGSTETVETNSSTAEHARAAAKEAREVSRTVAATARKIKNKGLQASTSRPMSYAAAAAANNSIATNMHNLHGLKAPSAQIQREILVNIRDPITTQGLRAMNPRNLKAHAERAIAQSGNENIANAKITSANQLKSGDLSIKTAIHSEMQALRQFADDWSHRIGQGASVRIPTYGVLIHGIRTHSTDMEKYEQNRERMLLVNRPFIPRADLKFHRLVDQEGCE